MSNPLIAPAQDTTTWSTGLGLVEDAHQLSDGIRNGSWVDVTLGGVTGSLDARALAVDPLGSLFAWGVGWLIEHIQPLRDALDWLAGKPGEIAAHASTWRNIAAAAAETHQRYAAAVRTQTGDWLGASGDAYRAHAGEQLAAIEGIATVTGAVSYAVEAAGLLVGLVREMVRDLIAQFVATLAVRLPQWLAAEGVTLGLATPVVAGQVATLVSQWTHRIEQVLRALLTSLRTLSGRLNDLSALLTRLKAVLTRLRRSDPMATASGRDGSIPAEDLEIGLFRTGDGIVRNGVRILMTRENVLAVAAKFGIDMKGVRFGLDKIRKGAGPGREFYGVTMPNGDIKLARDAFMSEEQLARTLAHERFHLDELRRGVAFPWKEADRAASEVRAFAYEEQWWQSKKHLLDPEQS
ncbi:hypothetical protein Aph02nite_22090 [Actinoplanes philippinensis]|uniref:Uncharacterized protein n=1 Tax=Actinoplanes philippinensis TaxID=35752 RepID=A0A1I2C4R1_9ACTN|nr:hypothetical protein [Actinoplanes philippinensis]GIE76259.1 hypothetical protein Aph02nite_22090 [Actinoplanes philippinensis]SFE62590.1 hypothetical protein SAMN05421541_102678 [Actinoplanes philippinensis]